MLLFKLNRFVGKLLNYNSLYVKMSNILAYVTECTNK
jgi:hypothetical protein